MTIKQKQCLLVFLGYYAGAIDGIWGDQSRVATEVFQRDYQLTVDGLFGPLTEQRIREVIANGEAPGFEKKPDTENLWEGIRHWTPKEFKCRCGEYHTPYCDGFPVQPARKLLELVDDIRDRLGAPGHRTSGIRCVRHNADEGGVAGSRHLSGKALDFWVEGVSGAKLLAEAQKDPRTRYAYQIKDGKTGKLTNCVHVDVE